jgi:hypothetical protein
MKLLDGTVTGSAREYRIEGLLDPEGGLAERSGIIHPRAAGDAGGGAESF